MPIPIKQASGDIQTGDLNHIGTSGPEGGFPGFGEKAGSILGGGIGDVARGIEKYAIHQDINNRRLAAIAHRQKEQDENLEVNQKYSDMRTSMSNYLINQKDNPSEGMLDSTSYYYDEYVKNMSETASSKPVRDELLLKAQNYKMSLMGEIHGIQTQFRQAQFGATFQDMSSKAENAIFNVKTLDELDAQKQILNDTIDGAVKTNRIRDPETIQALKDKVNQLPLSWGEANVADNPKGVIATVNSKVFDGVPVRNREIMINKAQSVIDANEQYDKMALRESLQSDIVQRIKTGDGKSLNLDRYEQAYGATARQAAERQLNDATKLHSVNEDLKGAPLEKLQKILKDSQPKTDPTDSTYAEQQKYADSVEQMVTQAQADKKDDAFSYFAQHPALKSIVQDLAQNDTPANRDALEHGVLEFQKMDKSLTPDDYRVMSKDSAKQFIKNFNNLTEVGNTTDGAGVRDQLVQFAQQYKDNLPIALNQLSKIKGGEAITPLINPLMWHLANPTVFRLTLDSLRKDESEQMAKLGTEKERKNFLTDAHLDSNFLNYQASMLSANNGADAQSLVSGVKQAYTTFARDYVLNGGKIKDASDMFFSNYSWGSVNGTTYARPVNYTDQLGKQHAMSDEQINLSNQYLEWYPKRIDPSNIDPSTILNQTKYFTSKELTKDVGDALEQNVFWSTTGDETGVYLYTKGAITGAPKQVKDKSGNPIRVNFTDSMTPIPKLKFGEEKPLRSNPKTSDTWMDDLANFLLRN